MSQSSPATPRWQSILRIGLLVGVVIIVFVTIRSLGAERLQSIVARAGVFGPLVYIALRMVASFVAPFSSGPLQLASGVLFGLVPAVIYSAIGSTLGYSISFWIARRYGRDVVARLVGDNIQRVDDYISRLDTPLGIATARLALYFAYDFVAYAAGLSRVPFLPFMLITFILGIPPITMTILVGLGAASGFPFR